MVQCLREQFLYSEKRPRDILFRAMEDALRGNGGQPRILYRLRCETVGRARQEALETGFSFANWETTGKTVVNAMLGAGVLLTRDGAAVPAGITAQATDVATLADGYQDLTEAYLLEFLIRKLGDVSTRDHTALAHALFRQFDPAVPVEDLEHRVVVLMATLAERVVLRDDGVYAIREPKRRAAAAF